MFHIYPTALDQHKEEVQAWTALRPSDRSAALYTTVLAASSTTTLYGLNITTENLVEWGMGLDIPPFVNELSSVLNIPSPQLNTKDVTMLKTPKKAIPLWLAVWLMTYILVHSAIARMEDNHMLLLPYMTSHLSTLNCFHLWSVIIGYM